MGVSRETIGLRVLQYRISQAEINREMPVILEFGTLLVHARNPTELTEIAEIQMTRMMKSPVAPLEYPLTRHVAETEKALVAVAKSTHADVVVWKAAGAALHTHDIGKVHLPNGDHPKFSADITVSVMDILVREGILSEEFASLVSSLVRHHHLLGDVVHGGKNRTEHDIRRLFPTDEGQTALALMVASDMGSWAQGRKWFHKDIQPALPVLLPKSSIIFPALDRAPRLG